MLNAGENKREMYRYQNNIVPYCEDVNLFIFEMFSFAILSQKHLNVIYISVGQGCINFQIWLDSKIPQ